MKLVLVLIVIAALMFAISKLPELVAIILCISLLAEFILGQSFINEEET